MEDLRKKAEEILRMQQTEFVEKSDEIKKVMHELQVYQIELELQNQELQENSQRIKETERKFYSLFNFSPVAFLVVNFKGIIEGCNFKTIDLLHHEKNYIINKPMISFIAGGMITQFYDFLEDAIQTKQLKNKEFSFYNKARDVISVEIIAQRIQENNVILAVTDVTERKNKDEQLKKALQKAEESDKLKSNFLNMISHEIRTPLNEIVGFSELIKKDGIDHEKRTIFAEHIVNGSNKLLSIVDDILIVSNASNEYIKINPSTEYLNDFLRSLNAIFVAKYSNKTEVINCELIENDVRIVTDFIKLNNIIERLVENALTYAKSDKINIFCELKNNKIRFHVKDNGIGIDRSIVSKLFSPFEKIKTEQKFHSGLGLGLNVAKKYCDLLSGSIWFTANPEGGSVFSIELPVSNLQQTDTATTPQTPETLPTKKTVLIAEDEMANFMLLKELLSDFDVNVLHAINGEIAVELFQEQSPDLILMDLNMPEIDGVTATQMIREINKKVPVLAITAYNYNSDTDTKLFDHFIYKPIDISAILELLGKYLS